MKLLTPQEALQAIIDGKKAEYRHPHLDWAIRTQNGNVVCLIILNTLQSV